MRLIAVYDSDNKCRGRCDVRCYDAIGHTCHCVCGGENHGSGERQSIENTRIFADSWVKEWKASHEGIVVGKIKITDATTQQELFD